MIETRLRGIPFYTHDNEDLSNAIRRNGDFWEADILDYLRDNYPNQSTIVDAGANIGNHTLYFATFFNYDKIVAFEPCGQNFSLLTINLSHYDPSKILLYPQGLSDKAEWTTLVTNCSNLGANEIHPDAQGERVYVDTLDQYSKWFGPVTLLKIDVEWWEPKVLMGAQKTLERDHPLILIEDTRQEYGKLLPQYELVQSWEHHNTFLYKWRE